MSRRIYYALAQRENGKWSQQFGDYSKTVVAFERTDMIGRGIKAKDLKIVKTYDDQPSINEAIAELNNG
jgi:hypothetical protein